MALYSIYVLTGSLVKKMNKNLCFNSSPRRATSKGLYSNDAIGFIQAKQRANISLTAFRASDYSGYQIVKYWLRYTAEEQQKVLGTSSKGLYFPAVLQLSRQTLEVSNKSIPLQPGMSLTADIHLRNRRFLSAVTDLFENKRRSLERLR